MTTLNQFTGVRTASLEAKLRKLEKREAAMRKAIEDGEELGGGSPFEGPVQVYIYRWNRCGRKGQRCKVIARGTMNSCLLEFVDGWRMVTSRNAIMKAK